MPRWGPDADNRLYLAAMELIFERGYDAVTVAEIAEHAGLRKRSFFRYFADKREVLFAGSADFEQAVVEALRDAPAALRPVEAVVAALASAGSGLTAWGEPVRQRHRVVRSSSELRERELIKLEALTVALATELAGRGVAEPDATLVAQVGVAAFATSFQRWAEEPGAGSLDELMADALRRLRAELGDPS